MGLALRAPALFSAFLSLVHDKQQLLPSMLTIIAAHVTGHARVVAVMGLPGAGKTYLAALFACFVVLIAGLRMLWAATANTPLASALAILRALLSDAHADVKGLFAWLPGEAQSAAFGGDMVIPLYERGRKVARLACALITSGSFAADIAKEFGPMSNFQPVHFLFFDESQGFGKWADALLFIKLLYHGVVKFIGDPDQPGGASHEKLQQKILHLLEKCHPAFRHPRMVTNTSNRILPLLQAALQAKDSPSAVELSNRAPLADAQLFSGVCTHPAILSAWCQISRICHQCAGGGPGSPARQPGPCMG